MSTVSYKKYPKFSIYKVHVKKLVNLILQNSVCLCDCLFLWNSLPNHAHYGDESFAGDSVGLGLGQQLNFIFKKLILRYFWGKIAPGEKNTV